MTPCSWLGRTFSVFIILGAGAASASTRATPAVTPTSAPNEIRITMPGVPGSSSSSWTIVALLTFLTLIPSLLLCMTPFARLLIVFHFLRQALGLQTTPSNQTLIGLALMLTFFLMQPVGASIYTQAVEPLAGRADHRDGRGAARRRAYAPVHGALRARKRCSALCGPGQGTAARTIPAISRCGYWCLPTFCPSSKRDFRSARFCFFPSW